MPPNTTSLPIQKVPIGGHVVTLSMDPAQSEYGLTHLDSKRITFSEACSTDPDLFWATLRHEMQHMALLIGGPAWNMTDGENESVVRCMDEIFFPAWDVVSARRTSRECQKRSRKAAKTTAPESTN